MNLLERVRAAKGADRELDADIMIALDPEINEWARREASMPCGAPPETIDRDSRGYAFRYTASLDAVLALVERKLPDCAWSCGQPHKPYKAEATIYGPVMPWPQSTRCEFGHHEKAATPALALLAALLAAMGEA